MMEGNEAASVGDEGPLQAAPRSWSNWQAARKGTEASQIVEMRLYSDAWFVSHAYDLGPYSFLNTLAHAGHGSISDLKPGIVLRSALMLKPDVGIPLVTSDDHYHGGTLFDEVTALAALLLEVRLIAGPIEREFGRDADPLGRPRAYGASFMPFLPTSNQRPQIPRLHGQRVLTDLARLATYPLLSAAAAVALVKAARLYQNALWIADSSPEMSWLLLVSAIETAANHWDGATKKPEERLAITYGPMIKLLEKNGAGALVPKIAKMMKGVIGATDKFLTFMQTYAPDAPAERPQWGRLDFSPELLKPALKRIYELRSRALHGGIPFPFPMCHPPEIPSGTVPEEIPTGLGAAALGATWAIEDTPMLLHTFAYLTRGALLKWWEALVPEGAVAQEPPFKVSPYG